MKMKKILSIFLCILLAAMTLAACSPKGNESGKGQNTQAEEEEKTIATKLRAAFLKEVESDKDPASLAEKLSQNEILSDQNMVTMEMEEGYLDGFDEEIKGFTKCVKFSPMIGTIPFVAYVFETDQAEEFAKNLEAHGQLNWNICTVADEMVISNSDQLVFFVMAPFEF